MKRILLIASLILLPFSIHAQKTSQPDAKHFVLVADTYYWTGTEGNLGLEITGKFQSEQKLLETLNLSTEVGSFKGRKYPFNEKLWHLRDILVSVDFNATGSVATWQVSGPEPLVLLYLENLKKQYEAKSVFYDFGYKLVDFRPSTS